MRVEMVLFRVKENVQLSSGIVTLSPINISDGSSLINRSEDLICQRGHREQQKSYSLDEVQKNGKEKARFLCLFLHFLASLLEHDVKRPNFSFMGYVNTRQRFSFSNIW